MNTNAGSSVMYSGYNPSKVIDTLSDYLMLIHPNARNVRIMQPYDGTYVLTVFSVEDNVICRVTYVS